MNTQIEALYESCANGEITLEEREEQIQKLRDITFLESLVENLFYDTNESIDDVIEGVHQESAIDTAVIVSPYEKYKAVTKALYEKCKNEEITEDAREDYIRLARECYLA